jgi:hypothetical protein
MICASILLLAAAQQTTADVTFDNSSQFEVYVFLKGPRKTFGPIKPRGSLSVPGGFALGDNFFVIIRRQGSTRLTENSEFGAIAPRRHVVYRAAAGRGPSPVNIDITNANFRTKKDLNLTNALRVENNTDYVLSTFIFGQNLPVEVGMKSTQTFQNRLAVGRSEVLVVAQKPPGTARANDEIVDVAFMPIEVVRGDTRARTLVVTEKSFGERGLPPVQSPPPAQVGRPSIDGTWRMPDGLTVRFEGKNGYWVEVGHLKDYGFKSGELGFRKLEEDPNKPGTFKGEVLYKVLGGQEDGWKAFTITVKDKHTLTNSAGDWKRVE